MGERVAKALMWLITGLAITFAAGWAFVQLLRGGQDASSTSSIVSMVFAAAGFGVALSGAVAAWKAVPQRDDARRFAEDAAATLAGIIEGTEREQLGALIGVDGVRLNLTFTRTCRPDDRLPGEAPERGQLDEGGASPLLGDDGRPLPGIARYYQEATGHRLVVTGPPGAGKTVLSLELLLNLMELRPEKRIPMRVSLAEWNTTVPFEEFLAACVVKAGISKERAAWITEQRLLIPILDGLDEMDPGLTDPDGNPLRGPDGQQLPDPQAPRALAALKALNAYGAVEPVLPLILVCRTDHYNALPSDRRLWHAVSIDIDPVGYAQIEAHLSRLFQHEPRWREFLAALPAHWSDPQRGAALRETLSMPWWLFLLKTVYSQNGDPSELFGYATTQALKEELLSLFIPAVVDLQDRRYDAEKVARWLGTIARHLQSRPGGVERVDIHQHQLWPIAGADRVRILDAATSGLLFLALLLPLPILGNSPHAAEWVAAICLAAVLVVQSVRVQAYDFPLCVPWGRVFSEATVLLVIDGLTLSLALSALGGLVALPVAWLSAELGFGPFLVALPTLAVFWSVRMGIAVVIGSGINQAVGSSYPPDINTGVRWRYVFRGDLLNGCATFIAAGISMMTAWWVMSFSDVLVLTSMPGLDIATVGLLAAALRWMTVIGGARRHLVFLLCLRGQLPRRLGRFLSWSHEGGLLRTSGGAYQFRHREFQQWLTATSPGLS